MGLNYDRNNSSNHLAIDTIPNYNSYIYSSIWTCFSTTNNLV